MATPQVSGRQAGGAARIVPPAECRDHRRPLQLRRRLDGDVLHPWSGANRRRVDTTGHDRCRPDRGCLDRDFLAPVSLWVSPPVWRHGALAGSPPAPGSVRVGRPRAVRRLPADPSHVQLEDGECETSSGRTPRSRTPSRATSSSVRAGAELPLACLHRRRLLDLAEQIHVSCVMLGALLADTPHTLPIPVSSTGSDEDLIERLGLTRSNYEAPPDRGPCSTTPATPEPRSASLWAATRTTPRRRPTRARPSRCRPAGGPGATPGPSDELRRAASEYRRGIRHRSRGRARSLGLRRPARGQAADEEDPPTGDELARDFERYLREQGEGGPTTDDRRGDGRDVRAAMSSSDRARCRSWSTSGPPGAARAAAGAGPGGMRWRRSRGGRAGQGRHRRRTRRVAMAYRVQGIPAVKAFKDGRWSTSSPAPCRGVAESFLRSLLPSEADGWSNRATRSRCVRRWSSSPASRCAGRPGAAGAGPRRRAAPAPRRSRRGTGGRPADAARRGARLERRDPRLPGKVMVERSMTSARTIRWRC